MFKRSARFLSVLGLGIYLAACSQLPDKNQSAKDLYFDGFRQLRSPQAQFNFNASFKFDNTVKDLPPDTRITINGAVDNAKQKYELMPEIKAGVIQVRLPLSMDVKEKSLLIDPADLIATLQMAMPEAAPLVERYSGKFVELNLASLDLDEDTEQMTESMLQAMDEIVKVAFDAAETAGQEMSESSFQMQPVEKSAHTNGISQAVNLTLDEVQYQAMQVRTRELFLEAIKVSSNINDSLKEPLLQTMQEELADKSELGGHGNSTAYFDNKGRILRLQDSYSALIDGQKTRFSMDVAFSNYGKARFEMQPMADQVIQLDEEEIEMLKELVED